MIERYFMEGVRFSWTMPQAVESGVNRDGAIVDSIRAASPMTYIGLSDKVAPQLMTIPVSSFGLQMRMAINYDWCDFATGRTARKAIGGNDILTGPMSGCYITRYTSGTNYVGHVGTVGVPSVDAQVKRKFAEAMPQTATGFNPFHAWQTDMTAMSQRHGKAMQFCALVTTAGDFYAIAMMPQGGNALNEWVCGGAKKVPPLSYASLRQKLGILTMGVRGG